MTTKHMSPFSYDLCRWRRKQLFNILTLKHEHNDAKFIFDKLNDIFYYHLLTSLSRNCQKAIYHLMKKDNGKIDMKFHHN